MVAELVLIKQVDCLCCSLAKISMVAELFYENIDILFRCSLAKISMVAELSKNKDFFRLRL